MAEATEANRCAWPRECKGNGIVLCECGDAEGDCPGCPECLANLTAGELADLTGERCCICGATEDLIERENYFVCERRKCLNACSPETVRWEAADEKCHELREG